MRDGWILVRAHGELVSLPRLTQVQWDALGDLLQATPAGSYRSNLLASLRQLRELDVHA